jgi:hypothetical protein
MSELGVPNEGSAVWGDPQVNSSEMAKHFSVDARAMLTWGRESIKDHTTAVLELVKNSYDAGATIGRPFSNKYQN